MITRGFTFQTLLLLATSVSLSSCGNLGIALGVGEKSTNNEEVQPNRSVLLDQIQLLSIEDTDCMRDGNSVALSKAQVWLWNGTSTVAETVDFLAMPGRDQELSTAGIVGAIANWGADQTCTMKDGDRSCGQPSVFNKGTIVRICRKDAIYSRESLESVTLTSQYLLESARSFYASLSDHKSSGALSVLAIQPQVIETRNLESGEVRMSVLADNASFSIGAEYGQFTVYPTSKPSWAKSLLNLWEAPFVLTHEYGHSIFNEYIGVAAKTVGLKVMHDREEFSRADIMRSQSDETEHSFALAPDFSQAEQDLKGVNELFADLFAFYKGGAVANQLKGIQCLDSTRDPSAAKSKDGFDKVWGANATLIYSHQLAKEKRSGCGEVEYDDEHDVAAVFGYNIVTLMANAMPNASSAVKANVLLKWLNELAAYVTAKGQNARLDGMITKLISMIVQNKTAAVTDACAVFANNAPGLPEAVAACK